MRQVQITVPLSRQQRIAFQFSCDESEWETVRDLHTVGEIRAWIDARAHLDTGLLAITRMLQAILPLVSEHHAILVESESES